MYDNYYCMLNDPSLNILNQICHNYVINNAANILVLCLCHFIDSSHSGHLRNTKNKTRVHRLMFNITSLSRDEDINLAEIRLYTLVENDRNAYNGVNRKVSVYQVNGIKSIQNQWT